MRYKSKSGEDEKRVYLAGKTRERHSENVFLDEGVGRMFDRADAEHKSWVNIWK